MSLLLLIELLTLFFSFFHQAWKMVLLLFFYPRFSKGQLISKGLFGILNSSKKTNVKIRPNYTVIPRVKLFSFIFLKNWRHQNDISKLTDLYT